MGVLGSNLRCVLCKNSEYMCGHSYLLVSDPCKPWFISHAWSENYCHWLLDCLSDVYYIRDNGFDASKVAVYRDLSNPFIADSLELLGLTRCSMDRQSIQWKDWIIRDFNVVINPMRHCGMDQECVIRWWNGMVRTTEKTTDVLIIRRHTANYGNSNTTSRNIFNLYDLISSLYPMTVRVVEFDSLPMTAQMDAVSSSRCVVGVSGAGLANALFGTAGSLFVELQNPKQGADRFKRIAECVGMKYKRFIYPKTVDNNDLYDWSMTVDVQELSSFIKVELEMT